MCRWISALYSRPSAAVNINETRSNYFSLTNGTRQGCPLSPIVFILTLEPLLCTVRANSLVTGLNSKSSTHKIAAFADDLLLFITNPQSSIPALMTELDLYGDLSNFKINPSKSVALNVSLAKSEEDILKSSFAFRWATDGVRYLGITLTAKIEDLYEANYVPLLHKIHLELSSWQDLALSWFGRCSAIKMTILPQILYLYQTIPIALPPLFFARLKRMMLPFVWSRGPSRLRYSVLTSPKTAGGLAFPDFRNYYRATHLSRLVDWCCHCDRKQWVSMELDWSPAPLSGLPWLSATLPTDLRMHPTIAPTIRVSKTVIDSTNMSPRPSPLTPVIGDLDFTPGLSSRQFCRLLEARKFRLSHFMSGSRWMGPEELSPMVSPPLDTLAILQLKHYLSSVPGIGELTRPLTPFETICQEERPIRHSLALMYNMLVSPPEEYSPEFFGRWETELGRELTQPQRHKAMHMAHASSRASCYQEQGYKIMTRWYRVPVVLHSIDNHISPLCWRCLKERGTMLHIFWQCPLIRPYWDSVCKVIQDLTLADLSGKPEACILHMSLMSVPKYKKSLTVHLLNAARACIPGLWRQTQPPTLKMWYSRVEEICQMEDLTSTLHNSEEQFHNTWMPWQLFRGVQEYLTVMSPVPAGSGDISIT